MSGLRHCRPKLSLEAMRWEPGDPQAAGDMAGWLLARGGDSGVVAGTDATATLRIANGGRGADAVAQPGDWVVHAAGGRFMAWSPAGFAGMYELTGDEP